MGFLYRLLRINFPCKGFGGGVGAINADRRDVGVYLVYTLVVVQKVGKIAKNL